VQTKRETQEIYHTYEIFKRRGKIHIATNNGIEFRRTFRSVKHAKGFIDRRFFKGFDKSVFRRYRSDYRLAYEAIVQAQAHEDSVTYIPETDEENNINAPAV
jgi:hypothetical protein